MILTSEQEQMVARYMRLWGWDRRRALQQLARDLEDAERNAAMLADRIVWDGDGAVVIPRKED